MSFISPALLAFKTPVIEKLALPKEHPWRLRAERLLLISDFASRNIQLLNQLFHGDFAEHVWTRKEYFAAVKQLNMQLSQADYAKQLRQFRHQQLLHLLLLEQANLAGIDELICAWSDCADALIRVVLAYCHRQLVVRHGVPRDHFGEKTSLWTLAMGKLGGKELNYSSDIDLIFVFTAEGMTDGELAISNQEYFTKVVQLFVQLMQQRTADGFVFRVDLRLRPYGDSGPLVFSVAAVETYYQEQGRDWERYAMVKARVVTEIEEQDPDWFKQLIIPFVYRRYIDFSVIESLRSMKAMIEREIQLNPRLDDIKRGRGGIRELEFIIQNIQLIRGGRLPQLRQQNAMFALHALSKEGLLPRSRVLQQAYFYLRRLENVLQSLNDQQTHSLPEDPIKQQQVYLAMNTTSWEALLTTLSQYQRIVSYAFRTALERKEPYEDGQRLLANQLHSLWHGHIETTMAVNLLLSLGFNRPEHCYQMIYAFRHSPRCRRLSQGARIRLDRFMVVLLTQLIGMSNTDGVLLQVLNLLEQIVGRSAYLALLTENQAVLTELLFWFAHSELVTHLLVNHPFLLEVLLDQEHTWRPDSRRQLAATLKEQLVHSALDKEAQQELLRQFKLTHWLMAARAQVYHYCSAIRIGRFLADVAQVIIEQVLALALEQLLPRYPEVEQLKTRFAIIAYGKLGSRELNYNSDLDLVFLYTASDKAESAVVRLTQKIVNMLTTRSQTGVLFAVDTRLRPSGSAGLLVSSFSAFSKYQKTQAWTWEHQSLLKARVLSGSANIKKAFTQLKMDVLAMDRSPQKLAQDILQMRAKIGQHQSRDPLKHTSGGLLDLEFLVQYLVLQSGNPDFSRFTHTLSQIKQLFLLRRLNKQQYLTLKKAYVCYHEMTHQQLIRPMSTDVSAMQAEVAALCKIIWAEAL